MYPAAIYLLYHAASNKVYLFGTDCEHENHVCDLTLGRSHEMKVFIRDKFNECVTKPNYIMDVIRQKKKNKPVKAKIKSSLQTFREQCFGR